MLFIVNMWHSTKCRDKLAPSNYSITIYIGYHFSLFFSFFEPTWDFWHHLNTIKKVNKITNRVHWKMHAKAAFLITLWFEMLLLTSNQMLVTIDSLFSGQTNSAEFFFSSLLLRDACLIKNGVQRKSESKRLTIGSKDKSIIKLNSFFFLLLFLNLFSFIYWHFAV